MYTPSFSNFVLWHESAICTGLASWLKKIDWWLYQNCLVSFGENDLCRLLHTSHMTKMMWPYIFTLTWGLSLVLFPRRLFFFKRALGTKVLRKHVWRILLIRFRRNLNYYSASFLFYILIYHLVSGAFFKISFHVKHLLMRHVIFSLILNWPETETHFTHLMHFMSMYPYFNILPVNTRRRFNRYKTCTRRRRNGSNGTKWVKRRRT